MKLTNIERSIKVGKSPKNIPMKMSDEEEKSRSNSESESVHSMDEEDDNIESADEELPENNVSDHLSSGEEGDGSSSGQEGDEDEEGPPANDNNNKIKANPGWADAMRKVLHTKKPKRKKTIVLSKAKKLCEIVAKEDKKSLPFEIEGTNGQVEKETEKKEQLSEEKSTSDKKRKRKEMKTGIRVKPSILDRERERTLQKIATKGVVQLFNAVRQQQMEIDKKLVEAGPLERKREKVLKDIDKRAFLDVLMGGTKSIRVDNPKTETKKEIDAPEEEGKKVWKVLRDDFVMGASLKDWDTKIPEDEDPPSPDEEIDSDD